MCHVHAQYILHKIDFKIWMTESRNFISVAPRTETDMSPKFDWFQFKSLKYSLADAKHKDLPPKLLYQEHMDAMMQTVSCPYS